MPDSNGRKTRLIFFSYGILEQGGGFEYYLIQTSKDLAVHYPDLDISIVTMSPEKVEKLQHVLSVYFMRKQDPKAIYRETLTSIIDKLKPVSYLRVDNLSELEDVLKTADVIYTKNEVLELTSLNKIGLKKLPPIIAGVHTPVYYPHTPSLSAKLHNFIYTGVVYRSLIKNVRSLHVNNADDLELIRTKLRFKNVKVVRQAFKLDTLQKVSNDTDEFNILFVGRLTEAKGIDLLVSIIKLLEKDPTLTFKVKIAGSGEETFVKEVESLASLSSNVSYLGHVPNSAVSELYDWCDVTLVTSKYETLNKVAIETATAGKVSLCTDIPGPREVVKDKLTGYLLQPNAEDFVRQVKSLIHMKQTDPDAFNMIGLNAYEYIKEKYDPQSAYKELYEDIMRVAQQS